jgi:glycosyltransferase involved in cell wall biosynthesis
MNTRSFAGRRRKSLSKVSVIIPTYDRAKFIAKAVDSALQQTYPDVEVIVVDDGSKDNTRHVLRGYEGRIRYFYQENRGIAGARNRGIKEAKGKYIAFLDSDDIWVPEKLAAQVAILEKNPNIGIVYHKLIILNEKGEWLGTKPKEVYGRNFQELVAGMGDLPTSSVVTRSECFKKAGLFDESMDTMEDFEMWLRIAKEYEIYEIDKRALAFYYRHDQQITQDKIKVSLGLVNLDKKILKTFKDIPTGVVSRRLAKNEYTLSRVYFDYGRYKDAFNHLIQGVARDPWVGLSFAKDTDPWFHRVFKVAKTYMYVALCAFKRISSPS